MRILSLFALGVFLMNMALVQASSELAIHGSGTSNPARCFGHVMEELRARSKLPLRLTYRSVGSSIGLEEFVNEGNPEQSALDFGSGEIPISHEDWQNFQDQNVTVLQLPTLFGAVSFFHSVPGTAHLNLTSCLLARIFMRDIKDWAHPDILEINPGLSEFFESERSSGSLGASLRIRVAVRDEGAGNTKAITQYLHKACPHHFPEENVGALPDWSIDTIRCRGTLGMNECIKEKVGTIGYNEAGIGQFAELPEISLENKFGTLLNSQMAASMGGIGAKENGILPENPSDDFSSVSLLDQEGAVRPILCLPVQRKLRIYITCNAAMSLSKKGIKLLEEGLGEDSPHWTFEESAEAITGAGDYVLSANRRNYAALERESNLQNVEELKQLVSQLEETVVTLEAELEELNGEMVGGRPRCFHHAV